MSQILSKVLLFHLTLVINTHYFYFAHEARAKRFSDLPKISPLIMVEPGYNAGFFKF